MGEIGGSGRVSSGMIEMVGVGTRNLGLEPSMTCASVTGIRARTVRSASSSTKSTGASRDATSQA